MPQSSDYPKVDQQIPSSIRQYLPEDSFRSRPQKAAVKTRKRHEASGEQAGKEKAAKGQADDV